MALTEGDVSALTTKGIMASGGVADTIFKTNAYRARLKKNQGVYTGGNKLTFPFGYVDDTGTNGQFYSGAGPLNLNRYEGISELSFDLKQLEETLVISHEDLAKNSGKEARLKLIEEKLKIMERAMGQRISKGVFSDGTALTGALSADQFIGMQAFLKSSSVNYGNVTDTDVPTHIAYVSSNSGTARALSTQLIQSAIGGCSEGEERPSVGIMRQATMDSFIELIKPHQRTQADNLDGMGHNKAQLRYSGIDFIVDNLAPATSIVFLNEKFVKLYVHPDYDMKLQSVDNLETQDAILRRLFLKGLYACNLLRYQGWLKDLSA
jgi:hypothetical protein